jgi:ATP-binding cassette, subfamily C (CFTR/MRP), member 1
MIAIVLSLVQSIVVSTGVFSKTEFDIAIVSAIASFVACIGLCPLLFLEHIRSIKPSDLAVVYLLVSLACDSAELGTTVAENGTSAGVVLATANLFLKFVLLVAECRGKERIMRAPYSQWPPEQLAGVLGRAFFWWINPILAQGNRNILTADNLPPMDRTLLSKLRRHRALQAWDQRGSPVVHSHTMSRENCLTASQPSRRKYQPCQKCWSLACCRIFSPPFSHAFPLLSFATLNQF